MPISGIRRIRHGCDCIQLGVEAYTLVLETIIHGGLKDTPMYNMLSILSEDLERHHVPNTGGNTNPPACIILGGTREGLARIKIEDLFIELVFKESGDVLKSTMSNFSWNLIPQSVISTYIVDVSYVFTSKEPTVIWCTGLVKVDLGIGP